MSFKRAMVPPLKFRNLRENKTMKKSKLPEKLINYLKKAGVKHDILEHKTVYTAFDAAATMKKKLGEIAKTLLVQADKDYYLVLLSADHNLDFKKLGKLISVKNKKAVKVVKIPGEKIMEKVLKVKAGALSAFGGFHKLPVIMDKAMTKAQKAVFQSGSFNHSVEVAVKDFAKLENALLGSFGVKKKIKIVNPKSMAKRKCKPCAKKAKKGRKK